ncbi:MAG: hypothetical protein AAF434_18850 [Pseudomonadota bacterium]
MPTDVLHHAIMTSLEPMYAEANEKKLWFFHAAADGEEIWCSPEYLQREQSKGNLMLAPEHWELRNPVGYMTKLIANANALVDEYNELAKRLGYEETLAVESHSVHPADAH